MLTHVAPEGPRCQAALERLQLPQLQGLLRRLKADQPARDDPNTLNPLAERLHAQALGLPDSDGLLPWAALQAQAL